MEGIKCYLASASPRRRELMEQTGFCFEVRVSGADENIPVTDPAGLVEQLSAIKAGSVAGELIAEGTHEERFMVIGADTVVSIDGKILGKPVDEQDASRMLREISGRTHSVFTGVTVVMVCQGAEAGRVTFHEETKVTIAEMTDSEIAGYVAGGDPMDKAGAYGIQSGAAVFVSSIEGDYYNVVGLPVCSLYHNIKRLSESISD
ncbi:MAG: septum formation protein Maf [Lachnospiraceae bacterium]|nr:septum formation protein Maf [Lachnospiraceae bacterium]